MTLYNKDGEEIPCEVSSKILFDETGKPIAFQGAVRDITKRKDAEMKKVEFIKETSHRFINPLCVLEGYVCLLTEGAYGDMSEGQKIRLSQIHDNILILKRLIRSVVRSDKDNGDTK